MRRRSLAVDAGLFLAVVLAPLAWTRDFAAGFTLSKFLVLNAAVFLAAWGAALRPEALAAGETPMDFPLLAGLFVAGLSAAASPDPSTNLRGRYDSYAYGLWGMTLLAFVVQLAARSSRGREAGWARWLIGSAALVGGCGALQKCGFDPLLRLTALPQARAVSTLGSPVDLGALLALAWPLALWRVDADRRPWSWIAAALIAGGLIACGSRGAWLAAGVGASAYGLMSRRRPGESLRPALFAALAAVGMALVWSWRPHASVADIGRREVWKTAWAAFARRPWLGWGPDGFEHAFRMLRTDAFAAAMGSERRQAYAHNDVLQVLASMGLLGAAAYAALLAALAKAARRALEPSATRAFAAALAAGLLGFWASLEFDPVSIEVLSFAAVLAGLLVSLTAAAPSARRPRGPLLALAALATFALAEAMGMASADAAFKRAETAQTAGDFAAARPLFASARRTEPCELAYIVGEVDAVGAWIDASRDAGERRALLERADEAGRSAVACHPHEVDSHYVAGVAARLSADSGDKDRLAVAARELDQALVYDPLFAPLLEARRQVARLMGDSKRAAELEAGPAAPIP